MKKILLTGSNGLLGQKIVALVQTNKSFDLLAISRGENRISRNDINYSKLDITNYDDLYSVVNNYKPNYIINTAAMTNVDECENNREGAWLLNVSAVDNLVRISEEFNCHLIHLSTDFIFDGESGPYTEGDIPAPISYYGITKLAGEKLILDSNIKSAIIRTVLVYGIAENMSRSNIVLWAKSALEKGDKMNIVNDQFRTPTLAEDLAWACFEVAKQNKTGIYNISGKDFMSIDQLIKRIAAHFGFSTEAITTMSSATLNQRAKRPPITGFVIDKAIKELDYNPRSFEEGLDIVFG